MNVSEVLKIVSFFVVLDFLQPCEMATTTIDLFNSRPSRKNPSNNPATSSSSSSTSYSTKSTRSIENFNPRPQIKSAKPDALTYGNLYTSYAPPPSGSVSYKNIQLPLASSIKIPVILPNTLKNSDNYAKHPGYLEQPQYDSFASYEDSTEPMLMIEEPSPVLLTTQHNKTIEAAKILASSLLEASGEQPIGFESENGNGNVNSNSTDLFIVKSQKKAYIIPAHFSKEVLRSSSAAEDLYPLRDQFQQAYTINQFIFVIKPEKINFLNKLV